MPPFYRFWPVVMVLLGLMAWIGQTIVFFNPTLAAYLGLGEDESTVDPALWADIMGEAFCDMWLDWTLAVAGMALWYQHYTWPYFGLTGGGIYLYFGVRGICQRISVKKGGIVYGDPNYMVFAASMCAIWAVTALITISMAIRRLEGIRGQYQPIAS